MVLAAVLCSSIFIAGAREGRLISSRRRLGNWVALLENYFCFGFFFDSQCFSAWELYKYVHPKEEFCWHAVHVLQYFIRFLPTVSLSHGVVGRI